MQTNDTLVAVKIYHSQIERLLLKHFAVKEPMFVWSPPACGKTSIINQICEAQGWKLFDVRLAQMDAVDVRGIPYKGEDGRTHYANPSWLPAEDGSDGPCVVFLDEYMQARPDVASVMGQAINERRLGEYVFPDNCLIVGASNRQSDRASTNRMPTQIANRFAHYELAVKPTEWCEWGMANGIDERVIGFIRFRPELVYQFDPKQTKPAYATLRTWEKVSNMIKGEASSDIDFIEQVSYALVGEAVGSEFVGFVRALDVLPDIGEIIANPDDHDDPEKPDLRYAVSSALSRYADSDNVENIWSYLLKLPAEFQILWSKDVLAIGEFDMTQHPVYHEVISLHRDILTT